MAPSTSPGIHNFHCMDCIGTCWHTGISGSSQGHTGPIYILERQKSLEEGECSLVVFLFSGIRKQLRQLHLLTLNHGIWGSLAVFKFRLPHGLPKLQPSCPKEVPRMEIITGVKAGIDSPTEKILGSAQESYCQHPRPKLSPAPLHCTAWLSACTRRSLCSKNATLKINPFYMHCHVLLPLHNSAASWQLKLTKYLASKSKYISYLGW